MSNLRLLWNHGIRVAPEPLAHDHTNNAALYEYIEGRTPNQGDVSPLLVDKTAGFVAEINRLKDFPDARTIGPARDSCASVAEHLKSVQSRIDDLSRIGSNTAEPVEHSEVLAFVMEELLPASKRLTKRILSTKFGDMALRNRRLRTDEMFLSPSDFGFHNALLTDSIPPRIRFLDFEYAGWDDPAKLICDFFSQESVFISRACMPRFMDIALANHPDAGAVRERVAALLPLHGLKWCCIALNDFLPPMNSRRLFSGLDRIGADRKGVQLAKARTLLKRLLHDEIELARG